MTLPAPVLDDRKFQDIVDEAKKRINHYCEEWTDHNVSDPGVTLIELFAWMTETVLYRMNQVPDRHYIKFMEMMGIRLQSPASARVPITFWLSAPQPTPVTIPAGTEVATTQTETERPIVFTTDEAFTIFPVELTSVLSRTTGEDGRQKIFRSLNLRLLAAGFKGENIFTDTPQLGDALYLGFMEDMSHHILGLETEWDSAGGAGVDPTMPPLVWEASTGQDDQRWHPCEVDIDNTKGLNSNGRIRIHLPQMGQQKVQQESQYWVRVRVRPPNRLERKEGMRSYKTSPRLQKLTAATWGGTTWSTHAQQIKQESLGQSDGSPSQRFYLQATPILKREPNETLLVHPEGESPQTWVEVPDFADSDAYDRHFTLDSLTGELRLGTAVRQPDGTVKLYGAVPSRGANLIFRQYRIGGGQIGNVKARQLNTLKTAIPFISRVTNRQEAQGGLDAETVEAAMMRMPQMLRSRERAVSESDFEFLALQALPAVIGRVKCLQPKPSPVARVEPGQVYVLVVPRLTNPSRFLHPEELRLSEEDKATLADYLNERRLLTTRLSVLDAATTWVSIKVQLHATPGVDQEKVQQAVLDRLYQFINPLVGGPEGTGWEFGRDIFVSDVYQALQGMPNVQFVRNVEMYAADPGAGRKGKPEEKLEVVAHGIVVSGVHEVEFV